MSGAHISETLIPGYNWKSEPEKQWKYWGNGVRSAKWFLLLKKWQWWCSKVSCRKNHCWKLKGEIFSIPKPRHLDVVTDERRQYKEHLSHARKKAFNAFNKVRSVVNYKWGLDFPNNVVWSVNMGTQGKLRF